MVGPLEQILKEKMSSHKEIATANDGHENAK